MADFVTVTKEQYRMCNRFEHCSDCPLGKVQEPFELCRNWITKHPEDAERIIMKWSMENQIVTNRKKFEEVFGFNVATMFEINSGNVAWLEAEYVIKAKEGKS